MKDHIGVYEFARRTNRDVTSLYKLILTGRIPAQKIGSGKRRVWAIAETLVNDWKKEPNT